MREHNGLRVGLTLFFAVVAAPRGFAADGQSGRHDNSGSVGGVASVGGAAAGGWGGSSYFGYGGFGPYLGTGFYPFASPGSVYGPPVLSAGPPPAATGRGPLIPRPPRGVGDAEQVGAGQARPREGRSADPGRSNQLVTFGDRLFRAGNTKKAEERYLQALRSNPQAAAPRIRLAQLEFVRGDYSEAANRLREAETAQPGWLAAVFDVQSIYGEPGDFNRHIALLESHLHAHPEDRDAWFVLGAQWYLSGRAAKAADVFLRLDDPHRRPDVALAAFLDATEAQPLEKSGENTSESRNEAGNE